MPALVTVLTRTLGRPCLSDAAASVAAQTYRPIEWVVVDASGRGVHVPAAGDVPVRVVSSGRPMLRARAGNFGLDRAQGSRAAVLDDDDLLLPAYVERLSRALDERRDLRVAYCDVRVETDRPGVGGVYAFEYSELMLLRRNLFPPNGGLFDLSLVRDDGVRYDVELDWFDDWDLWLRMSAHTAFLHVRETLAVYRLSLSQSGCWYHDAPGADPVLRSHEGIVRERNRARREALESRFDALKARAREAMRAGSLPEAAALWSEAHLMLPHDPEPFVAYAQIALAAGDAAAAMRSIESGLALMPLEPGLHHARAELLRRGGDEEAARRALEAAARLAARVVRDDPA